MFRDDFLKTLASRYKGQLVVSVYTTCFEWLAICPGAANYVSVGAMGQAGSHGLGLALGRPDQEVWILDGDGSLLMNLGSLVTLAGAKPRNLTHFVFQNGSYEANQKMPLPVSTPIDFAGIARAAGISAAMRFSDTASLDEWLVSRRPIEGPTVVDLEVLSSPQPYPQHYDHIHSAEARDAFRQRLRTLPKPGVGL
ncbi:MAG: thiamine pyrophosphate-binding protein [Polaromonas sp.]|nr:thiamine pyrophosphate-binding protein [Polaromonas sp.]